MDYQTPPTAITRRTVPAWLMSLATHLLAMLLLAIALRAAPRALQAEPDRKVGIVLTMGAHSDQVEYFDESEDDDSPSETAAQPAPTQPTTTASTSSQSTLPAPAAAAQLELPNLALPGLPNANALPGDELFAVPTLRPGGRPQILPGLDDDKILAAEAARQKKLKRNFGPAVEVSLFGGAPVAGHSFVFAIDRSKSMGSDGLGALDAAAKEFELALAKLRDNHQFQIIAYHHEPVYLAGRAMLVATEENKQRVQGFFAGLAAFGATNHELALLAALRLEPDVIFLLADGGDPYLTEPQIAEIRRRAGGKTTIHCIQFGFGPLSGENDFMQRLAAQTGGGFSYVDVNRRLGK